MDVTKSLDRASSCLKLSMLAKPCFVALSQASVDLVPPEEYEVLHPWQLVLASSFELQKDNIVRSIKSE